MFTTIPVPRKRLDFNKRSVFLMCDVPFCSDGLMLPHPVQFKQDFKVISGHEVVSAGVWC